MAWNQSGKPPAKRPLPPRRDDPEDSPPGLDDLLRRLGDFFGDGPPPGRVALLALLALAFVYGSLGFHQVDQGERAVVQRNGRLLTVQEPGLHWNPPVLDRWRLLDVERLREANVSTEVISADEDLVAVTLNLRYRITDPAAYLLASADAEAEMLREAESLLQQAAARLTVAELTGPGQRQLVSALQEGLVAQLRDRRNGLALAGLSLARVTTPAAIDAAVTDVERARADIALQVQKASDEARQALKRAEDEAARQVAAAAQDKARLLQEAQADAARLEAAIAAARTDPAGVRRRLYEEAVADVMTRTPTVIVGEEGLERLGIEAGKLRAPSPLPPPPDAGGRP